MWIYEKRLQYPVKIKKPNPALAKLIITQYGGPDGSRLGKREPSAAFFHRMEPSDARRIGGNRQ